MNEFPESASSAWDKLSAEAKEAHNKQIKGYADKIMGEVSSDWQDVSLLGEVPAMGKLPSQMLLRELRSRGCEVRQGVETSESGWEVRLIKDRKTGGQVEEKSERR